MRSIDLSNGDYATLMKWIGQRCTSPRPQGNKADEVERRAFLVFKKINRRYGTE